MCIKIKHLKFLKTILLSIVISVGYGCQSNYWEDRKNDSLDLFSFSYGYGLGVKPRIGPIAVSPFYYYRANKGFKCGEFYDNQERDTDSSYMMPFTYLEGFQGGLMADKRNKAYTSAGALIFVLAMPYRGSSWIPILPPGGPDVKISSSEKETPEGKENVYDPNKETHISFYTDIEVMIALGAGAKIGFNPGELVDFLLGWTTLDIFNDDVGIERNEAL